MGEWVEDGLAHLWVLGVEVRVAGKGLVGGEGRSSSSVIVGEGALVALGIGLRAPKHHWDSRKVLAGSD